MTSDGDAQGAAGLSGVQPDVSLPLPGPAGESTSVRGAGVDVLILSPPIHRSTSNLETNAKGAERNG